MRRVGTILAAATLGLAVLAGCSGNQPTDTASDDKSTETSAPPASEAPETPSAAPSEKSGGANAEYCTAAQKLLTDSSTVQKFSKPDDALIGQLKDLETKAPAEVKAEWTKTVDLMTKLKDGMQALEDPATAKDVNKLNQIQKDMKEVQSGIMPAMTSMGEKTQKLCTGVN